MKKNIRIVICIPILLLFPGCTGRYAAPPEVQDNAAPHINNQRNGNPAVKDTHEDAAENDSIAANRNKKKELPAVCKDSLYLFLKRKPLDEMSEREFRYFIQRDKLCCDSLIQYEVIEYNTGKPPEEPYRTSTLLGIIFSGISIVLSTILLIANGVGRK